MIVVYPPFPAASPPALGALAVAYVAERGPSRGPDALRVQIRAVQRRARSDGVAIGLLVIESGGLANGAGRGRRLDAVIDAAGNDDLARVLYVADIDVLANAPDAVLAAMKAVFDAGFELRAPCGRIAPSGRKATSLAAYVSRNGERKRAPTTAATIDGNVGTGLAKRRHLTVRETRLPAGSCTNPTSQTGEALEAGMTSGVLTAR